MKKVMFCILLAFAAMSANAQVIDGVNLADKKDVKYIQVIVADAGKMNKVRYKATVDYGQEFSNGMNFSIADETGQPRTWRSHMEIVNYFANLGWKLEYERDYVAGAAMQAYQYVFSR